MSETRSVAVVASMCSRYVADGVLLVEEIERHFVETGTPWPFSGDHLTKAVSA